MLLQRSFPGIKVVVVDGNESSVLLNLGLPALRVRRERLWKEPIRVAREVLRFLKIEIPRPLYIDSVLIERFRAESEEPHSHS